MPTYPAIQERKADEPVDLSNINYPISQRFLSAFDNTYEHSQFNSIVNNRPLNPKPMKGYPGTYPTTEEDIEKFKVDRPNLPNIPVGIPNYLARAVVSLHDNDRNLALMQEAEPSLMGKLAAFGGSTTASFLDIKALITSIATGAAGGAASQTIGKWGMAKLGASEIFGSKAANIGTQIVQNGITFGAANVGYQGSRELQETHSRAVLQQPQNYIQSLQNIGVAGVEGVGLGALFGGIGIGLFGRRVMRFEDGSFVDMPPEGKSGIYNEPFEADFTVTPEGESIPRTGKTKEGRPFVASREGGILNRREFNTLTPKEKQTLADNFKPWTPESDVTMTEEAAGQMMNGQTVNVDPIMKQGIADAGESFREAMRNGSIDMEKLDGMLSEAHDNVKTELAEAIRKSEELRASTKALDASEKLPITEESDLSQAGILKRAKLAQFEKSIMEQSPELVPENVRRNIETQKEIDRLNRKIDEDKAKQLEANPEKTAEQVEPNKKVAKRIEALEKRKTKILKPKAELNQLRRDIAKTIGTPEYGQGEPYQRLSELARVWKSAENLKNNLDLNHDVEGKINELSSHDVIINALRDHINDSHEGATHADVKDYATQLQSTGIPDFVDTAGEFEPKPERDIDAYLKEYPPEDLKSITEKLNDEAYNAEVERYAKKVSKIDVMKQMVKNMTDCLLKGAE